MTKTRVIAPTSGSDVLAKAASKAGQSSDDLRVVRAWLAEQLVAQEYAKLGQGGHTNTQVPLRQVFVDLPIASNPSASFHREDRTLFLSSLLSADPLNLQSAFRFRADIAAASHASKEELEEEAELFESTPDDAHFKTRWGATLLIGGPGQGKSTLGQLACQLHRAALIRPASSDLTSTQRDLVNTFIPVNNGKKADAESSPAGLPNRPLLPLQITLPDFAEWAARFHSVSSKEKTPSLLLFLADLPSAKAVGLDASKLFDLICVLPSLLVLDGFDEVGATQDRMRIVHAARELLTALSKRSASSQILATTRPQGYADELSQAGVKFQKVFLAPLLKEEALKYAAKLIKAKISGADQQAKALRQIHEAAVEPATERLLTTPLQVTILTALVQQLGRAPRERWNLFCRYFAYTFDREIERNTYASALLAEHRAHIERIHARVALLLQVEAERDGGASARMTKERLEEVISEVLAEDDVAKNQRQELIRDIASAAENRLVFLVEPEPGKFGFEIRSLQEFMAAWALTSGRDTEVEARLHQVAKAPMFRNVALFIASRLFSEGSPLRDILADRICGSLDEDTADDLSRLSRFGALLALETLEEGAALSQPKRARALMGRAVALLALPPGHEHIRLARATNEDTSPVLRIVLENGLASSFPGDSFCIPSAWACIVDATNRNETWAIELGDRYWTANSASSTLFSALSQAHVPLGDWICKKLEEQAGEVLPNIFLDAQLPRMDAKAQTSWVSWLVAVYGPDGHWRHRHRSGIAQISHMHSRRTELTPPSYAPPESIMWSAWLAAAKFDCNPTAENLSLALQALANSPSVTYWKRLHWRFSWPLAACINAADENSDLQKFADLLSSGRLGDTRNWIDAERAWKDSLDLMRALNSIGESAPWTLESIKVAPPLIALPVWWFIDRFSSRSKKNNVVEVLKLANEAFLSCHSPSLRKRLAEICLALLRSLPAKAKLAGFDPKSWIETSPDSAGILVPRPSVMPIQQWKLLLDACSVIDSVPWFINDENIYKALVELPMHPVLLKLAARSVGIYAEHYAFRNEFKVDLVHNAVEAMDNEQSLPPTIGIDVAVLKICTGSYSAVHDVDLLADISAVSTNDPNVWQNVLGALKVSLLPRNRINFLLSRVYLAMGVNNINAHRVIKEIRDALQKRTSDLDSQSTWDRLALPLPYPKQPLQAKMEGGIPSSPVRISTLELQDIGGLKKLSLELKPPAVGLGQWTVIIGPNGSGKTTILRSLALALRSAKHPSIWPKGAFSSSWQRIPNPDEDDILSSHILVTLGDGVEHRTLIRPGTAISITQLPEQDQPRLFPVFAYGCRRGSALGGAARQVNLSDEDGPEIATLFDEGADLIQAETWLVTLEGDVSKNPKSKALYESVIEALKTLMKLDSIEVLNQRLWVAETGKNKIPFSCLSDGYLTNAGWFLDLVARWLKLAERYDFEIDKDFLSRMRGLVLIDEIDLHLHPQWQIEIISRTKALLPEMSFVVTTHNPLTLVGAKAEEIWILDRSSGGGRATSGVETPIFMTGGQIYRQYFGINDIYPNALGRLLQRYSYLSGYALRDDTEQAELEDIQLRLADAGIDPGWEVVPRTNIAQQSQLLAESNSHKQAPGGGAQ